MIFQPVPCPSNSPLIKFISFQFEENNVMGDHVSDLTEVQIVDISSSSLSTDTTAAHKKLHKKCNPLTFFWLLMTSVCLREEQNSKYSHYLYEAFKSDSYLSRSLTIFRRQKKKKTILCVTSCSIVFVLVRISGYYHRICLTFPTTNFVIGKTPSTVWDKASSLQLLHLSLSSQVLVLVSQGEKILVLYFVVVKIFQQNKRISLQCWHWQFLNRPSFKAVEWKAISSWKVDACWKNRFLLCFSQDRILPQCLDIIWFSVKCILMEECSAFLFLSLLLPFWSFLATTHGLFIFIILNRFKSNLEILFTIF